MRKQAVVCAVERGWQNTRQLSLELNQKGYFVDILIKGAVEPDVLAMITKYAGIRIRSAGRFWFRLRLFFKIALSALFKDLKAVGIEGKRIEGWINLLGRIFNFRVFLITNESRHNL